MDRKLAVPPVDGADSVATEQPPRKSLQKERSTSSPSSERGGQKKAVDVACWSCRKRKAKCTAERPACAPCVRRSVDCAYEYDEGLTRVGSLKMRLNESTAKTESLAYLFEQLRSRSDEESSMLLAIIRLGADLDKIVAQLKSAPHQFLSNGTVPDMKQFMMDGAADGVDEMDGMLPSPHVATPLYFPFDQTIPISEESGGGAKQEGP